MSKILISYRRQDSGHAAGRLYDHLAKQFGHENVFMDVDSIDPGADFHQALRDAVHKCEHLIAVIGENWLKVSDRSGRRRIDQEDDWVRVEIEAALEKGIKIIPLLVFPATMPHEKELPESLRRLSSRQALFLRPDPDFANDIARLVSSLRRETSPPISDAITIREPIPITPPQIPRSHISFDAPFIGRDKEVEEVTRLFMRDETRLLTITGPGGIGKTRLACEIASNLEGWLEGGNYFVDLAEQTSVTGIANSVAESLGKRLNSSEDPSRLIARMLAHLPPSLLILDNFEQVVEFAETTVNLWRVSAPEVRILTTSRIVLNLEGEVPYPLNPMPNPPLDQTDSLEKLGENEAVQLFIDRAARRKIGFKLTEDNAGEIVDICRKLEGHPLSIVLVAQRIKTFPLRTLVKKLADRFKLVRSHRTALWDTIDWSFQLLSPHEKQAFLQACLFYDGLSLDAAEEIIVVDDAPRNIDTFDIVQNLCDHSLLISGSLQGEPRFRMLKSIQEFGWALLVEKPHRDLFESAIARWVNYYLEYAEAWNREIYTNKCLEALDQLVIERENILAVNTWAIEHQQPEIAARSILAYTENLKVRGPTGLRIPRLTATLDVLAEAHGDLRSRLMIELIDAYWATGEWDRAAQLGASTIELAETLEDSLVLAGALLVTARLCKSRGYHDEALDYCERSRRLFDEAGDVHGAAISRAEAASVYDYLAQYENSLKAFSEARSTFRNIGDPIHLARVLNYEGLTLWHIGDSEAGIENFSEAEKINRQLNDIRWVAGNVTNRGLALTDLDEFDEAMACFEEASQLHRSIGNRAWLGVNVGAVGRALLLMGDNEGALDRCREALRIAGDVGYRQDIPYHMGNCGRALVRLGRFEEAQEALEQSICAFREMQETWHRRFMGCLINLGLVAREKRDYEKVQTIAEEAKTVAAHLGLDQDHRIRQIREDLADLRSLEDWIAEKRGSS